MRMSFGRRMGGAGVARVLLLVSAAVLIGCASSATSSGGSARAKRSAAPARESRGATSVRTSSGPTENAIRDAMEGAGPDAVEALEHVAVLADPFLEGRAPDTEGNRIAAAYIEFHFRALELRPAFEERDGGERVAIAGGGSSYQEPFTVKGGIELKEGVLAATGPNGRADTFRLTTDFHPLGFSGNGSAEGPVVCVGYSIERGPQGYTSYKGGDDLTGKIALVLRYEPLDAHGESKWGRNGEWSDYASLPSKMQAAQEHGAAAVILVNPPGLVDARAEFLETHQSSISDAGVTIPVVQMTPAAAERLIATVGGSGGLEALRARADADEGGGLETLGSGTVRMVVDLERDRVPTSNVGAILPGKGRLANELVVIGAHYDHLGYGHFGARDPQNAGEIHPGADDNASGVAAVLLAARHLKEAYEAMGAGAGAGGGEARSVLFLAFSGEEMGLLGSAHFRSATALSASDVTAMINMDMVGRVRKREITVNGVGTSESWSAMVERAGAAHGLKVDENKAGIGPSDHTTFYQSEIPVLHFFSGTHEDYHTVGDTFEKLNYVGLAQVAGMVADIAMELATEPAQLVFVSTGDAGMRGSRTKAKVRLGIMPASYGETELPGVEVGEVFEGTSAAEAGFQKGDRLIRWGGDELPDVNAMVEKLGAAKPGDEVDMVVIRDGQEVVLHVVMHAKVGTR